MDGRRLLIDTGAREAWCVLWRLRVAERREAQGLQLRNLCLHAFYLEHHELVVIDDALDWPGRDLYNQPRRSYWLRRLENHERKDDRHRSGDHELVRCRCYADGR